MAALSEDGMGRLGKPEGDFFQSWNEAAVVLHVGVEYFGASPARSGNRAGQDRAVVGRTGDCHGSGQGQGQGCGRVHEVNRHMKHIRGESAPGKHPG